MDKKQNLVKGVITSKAGDRLAALPDIPWQTNDESDLPTIAIYSNTAYQEVIGIGGAVTESMASTLEQVSEDTRMEALTACFGPEGLRCSLVRTHINSCDFSLGNYSCDDSKGDVELRDFSIARDQVSLIPLIRDAMAIPGSQFKLLSSPWSPPAWMKSNGRMNRGGKLKHEHYDTWARYLARYIQEYRKQGIPIWGITTQDEPVFKAPWESCKWTGLEMSDFIGNHLGPRFYDQGLEDIQVLIWDFTRDDKMLDWIEPCLLDAQASKYITGIGTHWYAGEHPENLKYLHEMYPDQMLLHTEGCNFPGTQVGSYNNGEQYGRYLINDFNNWIRGWCDWNLILNERGGPNHAGNYCSAPIIADTKKDRLIYNPSYYYIAHFSKFVPPGSRRVGFMLTDSRLKTTVFKCPDGEMVVIVMNDSGRGQRVKIVDGDLAIETVIPEHSIITYVYQDSASRSVKPDRAVAIKSTQNDRFVGIDSRHRELKADREMVEGNDCIFDLIYNADGTVSLKSRLSGHFIKSDLLHFDMLRPMATKVNTWEQFCLIDNHDGTSSFLSLANNKYVSVDTKWYNQVKAKEGVLGQQTGFLLLDCEEMV